MEDFIFNIVNGETGLKPKQLFFFVHEYGHYSFTPALNKLGQELKNEGYHCFAIDMQGHGLSSGERGYWRSLREILDDHIMFIGLVLSNYPAYTPFLLVGEGYGSIITIQIARKLIYGFEGVVLIGTPIIQNEDYIVIYRELSNYLPKFNTIIDITLTNYTNNNTALKELISNPYILKNKQTPARVKYEWINVCQDIIANISEIKWPSFILHGEDDQVSNSSSSELLYQNMNCDKNIKIYPNASHSLMIDKNVGDLATNDIINWINLHYNEGNVYLKFMDKGSKPYSKKS